MGHGMASQPDATRSGGCPDPDVRLWLADARRLVFEAWGSLVGAPRPRHVLSASRPVAGTSSTSRRPCGLPPRPQDSLVSAGSAGVPSQGVGDCEGMTWILVRFPTFSSLSSV